MRIELLDCPFVTKEQYIHSEELRRQSYRRIFDQKNADGLIICLYPKYVRCEILYTIPEEETIQFYSEYHPTSSGQYTGLTLWDEVTKFLHGPNFFSSPQSLILGDMLRLMYTFNIGEV